MWPGVDKTVRQTVRLDQSTSVLSVVDLVKKNIAVLFIPGRAILTDMQDQISIFGYDEHWTGVLWYMSDAQTVKLVDQTWNNNTVFFEDGHYSERSMNEAQFSYLWWRYWKSHKFLYRNVRSLRQYQFRFQFGWRWRLRDLQNERYWWWITYRRL